MAFTWPRFLPSASGTGAVITKWDAEVYRLELNKLNIIGVSRLE